MMRKNSSNSFLSQIYLLFTLLAIPIIGLYAGLSYIAQSTQKLQNEQSAQRLVKKRNEFLSHVDEQQFVINKLNELFFAFKEPEKFHENLELFINSEKFPLQFLLFNPDGRLIADNLPPNVEYLEQIRTSGTILVDAIFPQRPGIRKQSIKKLRPIFGRNFYLQARNRNVTAADVEFIQTDFVEDNFRYWFANDSSKIVVVRAKPDFINGEKGIAYFIHNLDLQTFSFAHFFNEKPVSAHGIEKVTAQAAMKELLKAPEEELITCGDRLYMSVNGPLNNMFLLSIHLPEKKFHPGNLVKLLTLFLLLTFFVFTGPRSRTLRLEDLSILKQISLLMIISCGLPLTILGFATAGYFNSKRSSMIREKYNLMIEYIQNFDSNINLHYFRYNRKLNNAAEKIKPLLKTDISRQPLFEPFEEFLDPVFDNFNIMREIRDVAGNPDKILEREFFHRNSREGSRSKLRKNEIKNFRLLANQILSSLNDLCPEEMSAELAYVVEIFFQKPVELVVNDMLSIEGRLVQFPWGGTIAWVYSQSFDPAIKNFYDSYLLLGVNSQDLRSKYVLENLNNFVRNSKGFQAFAASNNSFYNENDDLRKFPEINSLFMKATDYPPPEPELIEFSNEKQIMACLNGAQIKEVRMCLLYPLRLIDQEIAKEAKEMIYIAVVALGLISSLLLILYLHLLLPVNRLHLAAKALENRDCDFRLPETKGDEFAEMASIFNQSMNEFEELKIANIVQAKLFPQQGLNIEGFSIYGKSLPMIELGGDYFDYFNIDQKHFALLLGDVAGHGVGASLIMAMAKAGVICSHEVLLDPASVLSRMHNIVLSIKNRVQRKVMTFQYVAVNKETNEIIYANAGGCTPVIIDPKTSSITSVEHPAPVLGGFKKSTFSNKTLQIKPGEAMVFYTDGMVESRNSSGKELGYQGLYNLFLKCYAADAEQYYCNILTEYRQWLQESEVGDDMTLIILVRRE